MPQADFWDSIAVAHRVEGADPDRPVLTPDPLESEPESDEEDRTDGIFSPQFVNSTGVHVYMKMCRQQDVVPVQQFISMLDHEVVSLKHRGVGAAGGKAIFECLRHNKHIQALDMEDNQLGLNVDVEAGALEHISAAIRDNSVLTNLDLSYNNFAGRGCAALAEALESNARIRELSLRGNNIGDIGAHALRRNLNDKNKLSKIDVSDNGIGEAGGYDLGLLIANTKSLKQADFSYASREGNPTHPHRVLDVRVVVDCRRRADRAPTALPTPSACTGGMRLAVKALRRLLRGCVARARSCASTSHGMVSATAAPNTLAPRSRTTRSYSSSTCRPTASSSMACKRSPTACVTTRRCARCNSTVTRLVTRV